MNTLESHLTAFLSELPVKFPAQLISAQKWRAISDSQATGETVIDLPMSISISCAQAIDPLRSENSYKLAQEAFDSDVVFSKAPSLAGYWGAFAQVLHAAILKSAKLSEGGVEINIVQTIIEFQKLRDIFSATTISFSAKARLFGVALNTSPLSLPEGTVAKKLSLDERNEKQPVSHHFDSSHYLSSYVQASTELTLPLSFIVDESQENPHQHCASKASDTANEIFQKIVDASLVVFPNAVRASPIKIEGGVANIGQRIDFDPIYPAPINQLDVAEREKIAVIYKCLSPSNKDKTLAGSLHRFILGRKRRDTIDRLVDYVIAWEALLLTNEGSSLNQELSYRFALNGALLIRSVDKDASPTQINKQLRSAYATRSAVVHGINDKERDEKLKVGDFSNLNDLCSFLENKYRLTIFQLAKIEPHLRPYRAAGGWDKLLWE